MRRWSAIEADSDNGGIGETLIELSAFAGCFALTEQSVQFDASVAHEAVVVIQCPEPGEAAG